MSLEHRINGNPLQNDKAILCLKSNSTGNYMVSVTYINNWPTIIFSSVFGLPTYILSINYRLDCEMHMEIFSLNDVCSLADMARGTGYNFIDCGSTSAENDDEMLQYLTKHVKKYVDDYLQYNKTAMH